jgi:hypothetical protein
MTKQAIRPVKQQAAPLHERGHAAMSDKSFSIINQFCNSNTNHTQA